MDTLPRERLPQTREGVTRRLSLAGRKLYPRVGCYKDGRPGELFITEAGASGTDRALLLDALGQAVSIGLQYGVPLRAFVDRWIGTHGESAGFTGDAEIPSASSILDLLGKWMRQRWPEQATGASLPPPEREDDA